MKLFITNSAYLSTESLHAVNIENEKALPQHFDQQILSSESRTNAIRTIYEAAKPPPAITKMNQFR